MVDPAGALGASRREDAVQILPLFFSQSPQLVAVLLFESSHFLDVLIVERFPQSLQLSRQSRRSAEAEKLRL